ncbi:unnamed protein product [Sphenostylis stenocarpa]|uniref:Uncharacterized protein n=1 Tax=Sphenostylis stenocarpa TaxID=92480 RepID=A0AA86SXV0_9FABA|nr:unnamed protein product [Sphenostylis stenocarpa]
MRMIMVMDEDVKDVGVDLGVEGKSIMEDIRGKEGVVEGGGPDGGVCGRKGCGANKDDANLDVGAKGNVKEGFGEVAEEESVELVAEVGRDERDKKGLSIEAFAVEEDGREDGENHGEVQNGGGTWI